MCHALICIKDIHQSLTAAQALSLFQSTLSLGQSINHDNALCISNYYINNACLCISSDYWHNTLTMTFYIFTDYCEANSHHPKSKARAAMTNSITSITWHAKQKIKQKFGWKWNLVFCCIIKICLWFFFQIILWIQQYFVDFHFNGFSFNQ